MKEVVMPSSEYIRITTNERSGDAFIRITTDERSGDAFIRITTDERSGELLKCLVFLKVIGWPHH